MLGEGVVHGWRVESGWWRNVEADCDLFNVRQQRIRAPTKLLKARAWAAGSGLEIF
jgi:hypothetical protein